MIMPMNLQFLLAQAIGQVGLMKEIWDLLSVMDLNINWLPKYGAKICSLTHSRHQMDDCAPDFNFAVCSAGAAQEFGGRSGMASECTRECVCNAR